ncbi:putative serine/threonine-protein kinase Sps1 [Nymphon striatum]|nr:putative serine/threonine-protein kinase Sps1 [Nymphon striatum]
MIEIPNYTVTSELGRGGMATVYLAVQDMLSRNVALKVMLPDMARDENFRKSFLSEGKIIASLEHPNIVRIHDVGVIDDSILYMAMEHLANGTLKEKLEKGKLSYAESLKILEQTSSGLDYAHAKGYIHRDIKPGNILFREDDTAVITDFGIAKLQDTSGELTRMGYTMGTVQYMSPEQAVTTDLDHRSDIYSLGLVFYEMLTGKKAFKAESTIQAIHQHTTVAPPELPSEYGFLQPTIDKVLSKEPDDRYQTVGEFVEAVKNAVNVDQTVIHKIPEQIDDDKTQILQTGHYQVPEKEKKGKKGLYAGVIGSLVLVGGLAFGFTNFEKVSGWLGDKEEQQETKNEKIEPVKVVQQTEESRVAEIEKREKEERLREEKELERVAEEQRLANEQKKLDEERIKKERLAKLEQLKEEDRAAEIERQIEEDRIAKEKQKEKEELAELERIKEKKRLAELEKKEEQERIAELERKEQERLREEQRIRDQKRIEELERKQEQARLAELERKEQQRLLELKIKADQERLKELELKEEQNRLAELEKKDQQEADERKEQERLEELENKAKEEQLAKLEREKELEAEKAKELEEEKAREEKAKEEKRIAERKEEERKAKLAKQKEEKRLAELKKKKGSQPHGKSSASVSLKPGRYQISTSYAGKWKSSNINLTSKNISRNFEFFKKAAPPKTVNGQIRAYATLNGRPLNTTFIVTKNGKRVKAVSGRSSANFVLPPGNYVITTQYGGRSSRANVRLDAYDIAEQRFAFRGSAPAPVRKPAAQQPQKNWTHTHNAPRTQAPVKQAPKPKRRSWLDEDPNADTSETGS